MRPGVLAPPGVYRPRSDTDLLAGVLPAHLPAGGRSLDLCTGTGALALHAAASGAGEATGVDVDRRAVLTARVNARRSRLRVRVLRGDLDGPVRGERFDLVTANPPYLPAPPTVKGRRREVRRWDAGDDGREVLDRICDALPDLLVPGGTALVVQSSFSGIEPTVERLEGVGLAVSIAASHRGRPGPIAAARADLLRARGLLGQDGLEELVVVRATRVCATPIAGRDDGSCPIGSRTSARSSTSSPPRASTGSCA